MLLTADEHRRLAEVYEEAAADKSHKPEDRAWLADKAARFRMLARIAEEKAKARRWIRKLITYGRALVQPDIVLSVLW